MTDKSLRQRLLDAMGSSPATDPSAILAHQENALRRQRLLTISVWLLVAAIPLIFAIGGRLNAGRGLDVPDWIGDVALITWLAWPVMCAYGVYCLVKLSILGRSVSLSRISDQLAAIQRQLNRQDAER